MDVPISLSAVARSNATTSRANLTRTSCNFSGAIQHHVEVKEEMSTIGDEDTATVVDARLGEGLKLLEEARKMDDNAISDDARHFVVEDATRQEMEGEFLTINNNGMSCTLEEEKVRVRKRRRSRIRRLGDGAVWSTLLLRLLEFSTCLPPRLTTELVRGTMLHLLATSESYLHWNLHQFGRPSPLFRPKGRLSYLCLHRPIGNPE